MLLVSSNILFFFFLLSISYRKRLVDNTTDNDWAFECCGMLADFILMVLGVVSHNNEAYYVRSFYDSWAHRQCSGSIYK